VVSRVMCSWIQRALTVGGSRNCGWQTLGRKYEWIYLSGLWTASVNYFNVFMRTTVLELNYITKWTYWIIWYKVQGDYYAP